MLSIMSPMGGPSPKMLVMIGMFALIGTGTRMADGSRHFRANFFRVQMNVAAWRGAVVTRDTPCGPNNCTYMCANCPDTDQPDFHQSKFFGTLILH